MGVAAVMVGLAVLLAIGYNWEAMPAALKLLIILARSWRRRPLGYYFALSPPGTGTVGGRCSCWADCFSAPPSS